MFDDKVEFAGGESISIIGAREHNLKNLSLQIPRGKFVVITGVSGSGKSTLAFDLLFSEGQRRFLDSMNVYARQFVEQMARPDVDLITGIPPTVSIEQRVSRGGGKSTVATVTEVYHFLRLLYARLGTQFCPKCDLPVQSQTRDEIGRKLQEEVKRRGDVSLLAPVVKNRKGFHSDVAQWAAKHNYAQLRADGKMYSSGEPFRLDRFKEHDVEVVTGVLPKQPKAWDKSPQQLIDETLRLGGGTLYSLGKDQKIIVHSTHRACPKCGDSFAPLDPKNFSYNSSQGWCGNCRGFGELFYLPDVERGARADAIEESWFGWQEGNRELCPDCNGTRLNPIARSVRLKVGQGSCLSPISSSLEKTDIHAACPTIVDIGNAAVDDVISYFVKLKFEGRDAEIARDILPEIHERLKFLREVGLGYLQLGRSATTLSGGEAQRIRLAAQLGSNLTGVLYVLDEPTIGLHARDNEHLLHALELLKKRGNSLVVVEHDEETMRRADYVIDLGPGAGVQGGEVMAAGTLAELKRNKNSITGQCLREEKCFPHRGLRRAVDKKTPRLVLGKASLHNLKNVTAEFPLHRFVAVSGVSGSGKSTLIHDCLLPALRAKLKGESEGGRELGKIVKGADLITSIYEVDQTPIGRTPRSIPATYVGFFDEIRNIFAQLPEARLRGYSASRFSFNSAQGRCPECQGAGTIKLEMNFLPPSFVRCEVCEGCRFNRETLDIELSGKNIAQVLELSIAEALEFFSAFQKIRRPLEALRDTGLDYLKLGQTSPTLSGGEAQRIKLVTHLLTGLRTPAADKKLKTKAQLQQAEQVQRKAGKSSLFILEEPTIGLHMSDVKRLVEVIQRLVDAGNSVIVIEHNLDLIAEADWVVDLGPEAGEGGGEIVAQGSPEDVVRCLKSYTGQYLKPVLQRE